MRSAYFAGGCFWCITPFFRAAAGVSRVVSGYSGGGEANPTYEQVKGQKTGHRECVRVEYDPAQVDFSRLMDVFLDHVDPFDGGGQFIDRGRSYTLAVYCADGAELEIARGKITALEAREGRKAQIALEPFTAFYDAEDYHQDYDLKNPEAFDREMRESGRRGKDDV